MNYTIYLDGEAIVMAKTLGMAEFIADHWPQDGDLWIVDKHNGKVFREFLGTWCPE